MKYQQNLRVPCELNIPGLCVAYNTYDFLTAIVLKSHVSNSIVNMSYIQYGDITRMAYYLRASWDVYDCIVIARMTPQ